MSTLLGMPFTHFIAEKDMDLFYFHRNKLLESRERETCELRLVKKDGNEFYAKLESIYVENSEADSGEFHISMNDIDEQKKAAEALRKSEFWLQNIFNSLEESVFVVTPDRKLVNINQAAQRMFG
jgi:PAS domain-containing protein